MRSLTAILVVVALLSPAAFAYEDETHRRLTQRAIDASSLKSRLQDYGMSMGIYSTDSALPGVCKERDRKQVSTVREWIECGAVGEDHPMSRSISHFYNPLTGRGLPFPFAHPSVVWGLGLDPVSNEYTLKKARTYLYEGVLGSTEEKRKYNLALAFESLGHAVHLVEDLAQPQHTRSETHLLGSAYEKYMEEQVKGSYAGFKCLLSFDNYPPVAMQSPYEYWSKSGRRGLADYSANGFVTEGTNFSGRRLGNTMIIRPAPGFPLPNDQGAEIEKLQITDLLGPPGPKQPFIGEIWFIQTPVTDYNSGSMPPTKIRMSTFSIFDEDLASMGGDWTFTLNAFNYCHAQELLLPRAVGYSAGLINYFFRGKLEISAADRGAYGYVDHSAPQGFWSITAKIKNATPDEVMAGGQLIAAVKFHRNHCYKPDLSGEFMEDSNGNTRQPCPTYRSKEEEMVLSKPLKGIRFEKGQEQELTFELLTPIPMNATDVYLQVVYSGALGSEADGIAVGARKISEPTFVTIANSTDMYQLPTSGGYKFFPPEEIKQNIKALPYSIADINRNGLYDPPGDYRVDGGDLSIKVFLKGARFFNQIANIPALPKGRFSRLALLVDPQPFKLQIATYGLGFNGNPEEYDIQARNAYLDFTACKSGRCPYRVGTVYELRKLYHWWSLTLFHGHPPAWSGFEDMPANPQPEAVIPIPVELVPPIVPGEPLSPFLAEEPSDTVGISVSESPGASRIHLIQLPK